MLRAFADLSLRLTWLVVFIASAPSPERFSPSFFPSF